METILEKPRSGLPLKQLDQTSLHLLPCGIQHDGKANIPGFFFLVDGEYTSTSSLSKPADSPSSIVVETLDVAKNSTKPTATDSLTDSVSTTTATTTTTTTTSTTTASSTAESLAGTTTESKPSSVPETSFRGRTLKGTVVSVPEGYIGSIYKSVNTPSSQHSNSSKSKGNAMDLDEDEEYEAMLRGMQEERKTMRAQAQFTEFMIWGHDEQPSLTTDKVVRAMQWIDIAKVLHEPLC
ncbi:hypothetical protein BGZ75_008040 [Mortierella antarctica]|nr:hypothetical protein BGZ75_008040 [Mortierella antarctica]